ncbi:unnamed protein product [Effrenium voratum]|uniref:Globin family profile domain-containing protein n=1 Tax=Effrenium voratum TaxID=2562239 RepID=A0AA36JI23_9DINO|nr:unnamed protein product [Effrenium voratum]CAJ1406064.1 unnamed protein product [Effrenium voratum]CAJ1434834.1 unnamed protein product [Effrenium voratum]
MSGYRQDRQLTGAARNGSNGNGPGVKPVRALPNGPGPATRRRMVEQSPVTAFLREIGMPQYAEVFKDHGFDDMETLMGMEEEHMRDMGMPSGHIVKLRRRLQEAEAAGPGYGTQLAPPRTLQGKGFAPGGNTMTAVQMSWQQVKNLGTDVVGGLFYKKFFKMEPSAKALFPIEVRLRYKDWDTDEEEGEDPTDSPALRKLWAKFITVVGSAVAGIQDTGKLVPMLQQLGMRHVNYGLKAEYFNLAGKILIEVLAEWLGDSFTKEVENAWSMVAGFMVATMYGGYAQAALEVKNKELQLKERIADTSSDVSSTCGGSRQISPLEEFEDGEGRLDLHGLSLHTDLSREQVSLLPN